jgi:hypothetical protein
MNLFLFLFFVKVDRLTNEWFLRAHSLSFKMKSELTFCQELTLEHWRKSAKIPRKFLKYSKVDKINKNLLLFIFTFLLIFILFYIYYFQNDHPYLINTFIIIIYLFIITIFTKTTKTNKEHKTIILPRLNFNH